MFKWKNFSESLLVRSVYLITIPIVLVQIIGIIIFFELHWDLVLKRSAQSISNEIKIFMNIDNNSYKKIKRNALKYSQYYYENQSKFIINSNNECYSKNTF